MEPQKRTHRKALIAIAIGISLLLASVGAYQVYNMGFNAGRSHSLEINGGFQSNSGINGTGAHPVAIIDSEICFYQYGKLVFKSDHPGLLTYEGYNLTTAKLAGNSDYNMSIYNANATYVSIGYNTSSLTQAITVLPGEWNRTAGAVSTLVVNANPSGFNVSATIYPDVGPYNASCLGLNYESGIGNNALFAYDSFNLKTGIDNTFVITINIKYTIA